jgi:DNA-binding transcriptional ArsR family regulator
LAPGALRSAAELFRSLGHPLRLQILCDLEGGVLSASELAPGLEADLGVVSYHLRALHDAGFAELVETRAVRGSLQRRYELNDDGYCALAVLHAALAGGPGDPDAFEPTGAVAERLPIVLMSPTAGALMPGTGTATATEQRLRAAQRAGMVTRVEAERERVQAREQREAAAALRAEGGQARRRSQQGRLARAGSRGASADRRPPAGS